MPSLKRPKSKWHYPLNSMHFKCKVWTRFRRKQRLQKCPNGQGIAIFTRLPKTPIFWKSAKGVQGKFFKNRLKGCPSWKGPKSLRRKCHYPLISMRLKCKDWTRYRRTQRLQTWPNGLVMAIFGRSPKTCIFWKKAKGRARETFKKSPKTYPSLQRDKRTLAKISLSSNLYPLILQRLEKIFVQTAALEVPEWPSYGNSRKSPKTRIFWKSAKGGPREVCQKSPKK